jgi:hypothetical protein
VAASFQPDGAVRPRPQASLPRISVVRASSLLGISIQHAWQAGGLHHKGNVSNLHHNGKTARQHGRRCEPGFGRFPPAFSDWP